jgi:uncharacterized protein
MKEFQLKNQISLKRFFLYYLIAIGVSNIFRQDLFHLNGILEKISPAVYLVVQSILEGSGIIIGALLALKALRKERKTEISFWGTSKTKGIIMALIPTILLVVIGVKNTYGYNVHGYGLLAAFGTLIYCILEEYGWRGYLEEEFKFLKPIVRIFSIGFIWYFWHLSFLTNHSVKDNLFFLGCLIAGSFGIGKVAEVTKSILACACFHLIVNMAMFNSFFTNAFTGNSQLIIMVVSIVLWVIIMIWWGNEDKKAKALAHH